jgi:hypothetical protein
MIGRPLPGLLLAAGATVSLSLWDCRPSNRGEQTSDPGWRRESLTYARQLDRWHHDSVVVESLSRPIRTESLLRLYHSLLTEKNPRPFLDSILCAQAHLSWRYGALPAEAAINRVRDTVLKIHGANSMNEAEARMPTSDLISLSNAKCGEPGSKAPDSVDGTSIEIRAPRPVLPPHP